MKAAGRERVAGLDADVVAFIPRDAWRFGYRIWAEQGSGLALQLQTLDAEGRVLEQAAFSELAMESPAGLQAMLRMMGDMEGYRRAAVPLERTTADAEGWRMRATVAGFVPQGCYKKARAVQAEVPRTVLQCIYSDGLATLSVFLSPMAPGGTRRVPVPSAWERPRWWRKKSGRTPGPPPWGSAPGDAAPFHRCPGACTLNAYPGADGGNQSGRAPSQIQFR